MKRWIACVALLAPALGACGGDDAAEATGAPMAAAPEAAVETRSKALNSPPVIEQVVLSPNEPRPGDPVTARVSGSDPDGDHVTFRYKWLVDGRDVGENNAIFRVRDVSKQSRIEVVVVATDGSAESDESRASVRVGNLPPIIQGIVIEPLGEVTAGHDVIASPRASDPENDEIRYRYRWDVNGSTVPVTENSLPASYLKRGDTIVVSVVASDGRDSSEPLRSAEIPVVNSAPKFTSTPGSIDDDGVFRYKLGAEDPDGERGFRYRLLEAPSGMDLDLSDGQLVWAPNEGQTGKHAVKVEVADQGGAKSTQSFTINVSFGDEAAPESTPASQR